MLLRQFGRWNVVFLYIVLGFAVGVVFFISMRAKEESQDRAVPVAADVDLPKDKVKKFTLENGMTVLVFENRSVPKTLIQIAYDIGSGVEDAGERGLAHLLEHMIFKGTQKLSETDIDSIARKYGASFNAFTSQDVTSYYFEVDSKNWQHFVPLLADCMQNARFESEHLASELYAVIAELKMNRDSYWRVMYQKACELIFPPNHPYHFPIIGFKEDLVGIEAERLKKFYKKYYQPSRATLFVVGDVDADQVHLIAKENFEKINEAIPSVLPTYPKINRDLISSRTVIYRDVEKPLLGYYFLMPGLKDKKEALSEAVVSLLGVGEGSRLYRRLVDEEKIARSISVFSTDLIDAGILFIFLEPKDGCQDKCRASIENELEKIISKGLSDYELGKIIRNKQREHFELFENNTHLTYQWIKSYFATRDEYDLFEHLKRLAKLASSDVQMFASQYLSPALMNEIEILPASKEQIPTLLAGQKFEDEIFRQILAAHKRTTPLEEPKLALSMPTPTHLNFAFPAESSSFKLSNGLQVLLYQNHQWPLISANLVFRNADFFASARESVSLGFLMEMLFEGSAGCSKKDNVEFFESAGAAYNFGVSGGSLSMLSGNYAKLFERFLDVLSKPTFPRSEVEKLRSIYIDKFISKKKDPFSVAKRLARTVIYPSHPYSWTLDDAIYDIKKLSVRSLKDLHKKHLHPSHMILSIAGDFEIEEMKKTVSEVFSKWDGDNAYSPQALPSRPVYKPQNIDHYMLRDQAVFMMVQPSPIDVYHPDLIPLRLLNYICFHSLGSRLYKIREQTGLFYSASGAFGYMAGREQGFDFLSSILDSEKLSLAQRAMESVVEEVAKGGVTQSELEVARRLYTKTVLDLSDNNSSVSSAAAMLEALGLGLDYYNKALARVNRIGAKELGEVAKKYFSTKEMSVIRVGRVEEEK